MRHKRPTGSTQRPFWALQPDHPRDDPVRGPAGDRRDDPYNIASVRPERPPVRSDAETFEVPDGHREKVHRRGQRAEQAAIAIGALFLVAALLKPWASFGQAGVGAPDPGQPSEQVHRIIETQAPDMTPVDSPAPSTGVYTGSWAITLPADQPVDGVSSAEGSPAAEPPSAAEQPWPDSPTADPLTLRTFAP